jgi:threonine dehydrogenase-like Zn-dependent dehydrogenase
MRQQAKEIGLAIIGAGRVGLFRGEVAARHPAVKWIGIAEKNHNRGLYVAEKIGADFVTQSCSSDRRSPASSSPPTSICTSIRSWDPSSAACRC